MFTDVKVVKRGQIHVLARLNIIMLNWNVIMVTRAITYAFEHMNWNTHLLILIVYIYADANACVIHKCVTCINARFLNKCITYIIICISVISVLMPQ